MSELNQINSNYSELIGTHFKQINQIDSNYFELIRIDFRITSIRFELIQINSNPYQHSIKSSQIN